MVPVKFKGSQGLRSTEYSVFKGVDFSKDALLVDRSHSPDAVNMISDEGGYPCTRPGWKSIRNYEGKINGIMRYVNPKEVGNEIILVHSGKKIICFKLSEIDEPLKDKVLIENINDEKSVFFYMDSALYILTGKEYLVFDGTEIKNVEGTVPLIAVGRTPAGGGGTVIETPNLISDKWKEGFRGDGTGKEYSLLYTDLSEDLVVVEETLPDGTVKTKKEGEVDCGFSVDRKNGKITFAVAPPKVTGEDNIVICAAKDRTLEKDKILKAKNAVIYNNTVFLCGSVKGTDFHSGINKPCYFPDTGYDEVGTDNTDIMGYVNIGKYLAIIKEQNGQDPSIYIRYDVLVNDETTYMKEPSVSGLGAVSRNCFGSLKGEPLFLSKEGMHAITSNIITNERIAQNRSFFVDSRLTREENLENAVAIEFKGRFYAFVNGNVYILDGTQDKRYEKNSSSYIYECFFWNHVPAISVLATNDDIIFGTADGRVCIFNKPKFYGNGDNKFYKDEYTDDGEYFVSRWSTNLDDDGNYSQLKSIPPNDIFITLKAFSKSKVVAFCKSNNKGNSENQEITMNLFAFDFVDFKDIDFRSREDFSVPNTLKKSFKRYNALKIVLESRDGLPFGIFNIIKRWHFVRH